MYRQKKIAVVMPAYNAERTLHEAYDEVVAQGVADTVIIVDDCSKDETQKVAESLVENAKSNRPLPTTHYQLPTTNFVPSYDRLSLSENRK